MNSLATASAILLALLTAIFLGSRLRRRLPEHHLNSETKDSVKLAMGMVATMSALLLGLLVSSAKGSYDQVRSEVIQLSASVQFLDRVLRLYGPEAAPIRAEFHTALEEAIERIWAPEVSGRNVDAKTGDLIYSAIQGMTPQNDMQRALKAEAIRLAVDMAQKRTLLQTRAVASISRPLLIVVVVWLVIIFFSFSVVAPINATAILAQGVSAVAVTGAIFLILEMDRPFSGLVHVSSEPMVHALDAVRP